MVRKLVLLSRLALGVVFLYAAYTKLRQPAMLFALSIDSYRLLPEWAVVAVARTLPWVELALGALLVLGYKLRYVATVASAILLLFFGVMLRSYFKGLGIDCGCFGVGEALGPRTLARDAFLVALSIALTVSAFLLPRRSRGFEASKTGEAAQ